MAKSLRSSDGIRWREENRPCPICNSSNAVKLGPRGGRAHREGKGVETDVVQCLDCCILYSNPTLLPESNPYAIEVADEYFRLHDFEQKVAKGEKLASFAGRVLGKSGRMLELGCGRGELLKGATNLGWKVKGVEMTENYANAAQSNGIDVECSSILECKSLEDKYDVILLVAVLEHLYEPMQTFHRIRESLRPGGLLYVEVPNEFSLEMRIGNAYMRLRSKDWVVNLSPTFHPFHVVGFSLHSLRRALAAAGFRIHTMYKPSQNNAMPRGEGVVRRIELLGVRLATFVGHIIGMGDNIECWAVRP